MPWSQTSPMNQKVLFIADHLKGSRPVVELCAEYRISRKTAYKWIERYIRQGAAGLEDRSRRPRRSPRATSSEVLSALLELRRRHPSWGAKKLLRILRGRHPQWKLPSRSGCCLILQRHGLIRRKTRRRVIGHPGKPGSLIMGPNHVWCADFKGHFRMGNGRYCYPLTVTLARLSKLSAWWVRLGVMPQLIEPGNPQQNGRHERMHRTLKAETTRPPAHAMRSQQLKFDRFKKEFNHERPHEALDQETPDTAYQPSARPMPSKLPPIEYPDRFEVRYVSANGGIRWNKKWVNVSSTCIGEYVGFEEIDDGVWNVYFGALRLGRFDERNMRIEDAYGRLFRHR